MPVPKILVVADSDEADHLTSVLREAGLSRLAVAHGSEDALAEFEKSPATIVVITATLEEAETDVQELCEALRAAATPAPSIVLVGDEDGPVRTALDAMEYGIERFLRRPLSPKSLTFAVRSCVTTGPAAAAMAAGTGKNGYGGDGLGRGIGGLAMGLAQGQVNMAATLDDTSRTEGERGARPGTSTGGVGAHAIDVRIEKATSKAIDDFINDAVDDVLASTSHAQRNKEKNSLIDNLDAGWEDAWLAPLKEEPPAESPVVDPATAAIDHVAEAELGGLVQAVEEQNSRATRVAASSQGSLRDNGVAMVLAQLHRDKFTGSATFRRAEVKKNILFDDGRPVFATSNLPHDRMGDLLYREGKITREQYNQSRELVADTGRRMGEVLVDIGFLKRRELLPAVRRHVKDIIYSLFAWQTGHYRLDTDNVAGGEKIRLADHPVALVLEGVRRKMGLSRLKTHVGGPEAIITPIAHDELAATLSEVDLSSDEQTTVELFDGQRSLTNVVETTPLSETTVYQLAYGLIAAGLAQARTRPADGEPATESSSLAPRELKIDRDRIMARHALVADADYFAVLGVRRDASEFEIKRAYETARSDYAAKAFPEQLQKDLASQLKEILQILHEAYQVLRNDAVREHYIANLQE